MFKAYSLLPSPRLNSISHLTMRFKATFLVALCFCFSQAMASPFVDQAKSLYQKKDDLGLRILIRKNFKSQLSLDEWQQINKILSERPNVGFDVIIAWYKQQTVKSILSQPQNELIQKELKAADALSLNNNFEAAFKKYQLAAQLIRQNNNDKVKKIHLQLYFNVLQQMGRTLYAMKRFNEALEVYDWISPTYYQFRQVLFEKMWAAFRASKYDRALGSIASQQSIFYSNYLEPESYLIKVYILKRLCRDVELKQTLQSLKTYLNKVKSQKYNAIEWAKNDILRISLSRLLVGSANISLKDNSGITQEQRLAERKAIFSYLQNRFTIDRPRIIQGLEKAYGYSSLALKTDQKILSKITDLPDSKELEKAGNEYWLGSSEEWVDEIGSRIYVGDSLCAK